ncbi:unnamed protein product [Arctogadus glacialis]
MVRGGCLPRYADPLHPSPSLEGTQNNRTENRGYEPRAEHSWLFTKSLLQYYCCCFAATSADLVRGCLLPLVGLPPAVSPVSRCCCEWCGVCVWLPLDWAAAISAGTHPWFGLAEGRRWWRWSSWVVVVIPCVRVLCLRFYLYVLHVFGVVGRIEKIL